MVRRLSEGERKLWSRVTRDVRRTLPKRVEDEESAADEPKPKSVAAETAPKPRPAPRRTLSPPQDISEQRRIRRGQAAVDARIDLHGHTYDAARAEFARFILRQHATGARCVLVITGKGRAGRGVLRSAFPDWINDKELRPIIAGYARAHLRHGGEGAFYVMLKAHRGE